MNEHETDIDHNGESTGIEQLTGKARSMANLRPYRPGQSGNPRGVASDGLGAKDHPIRATLRKRLQKRRTLERLVDTWIEDACTGDAQAREQILKRLDPVLDDNSSGRQVVYEGLLIETPSGARAELVRGLVQALDSPTVFEASCRAVGEATPPSGGFVASVKGEASLPTHTDAVHTREESYGGPTGQRVDDVVVVEGREESYVGSAPDSVDHLVDPATLGVNSDRSAQGPRVALRGSGDGSNPPDHEASGFGPQAPVCGEE